MKSKSKRHKGRRNAMGTAVAVSRRVVVEFPEPLLEETERAATELGTNRSRLIRSAVEQYLSLIQQRRLEQELAAGYMANSALDQEIAEDFAFVDAENL